MIRSKHVIWEDSEYSYAHSAGFVPFIESYIHSDTCPGGRPAMLVIPGGGYCFVSPAEAEPVAMEFYRAGYNAFVLTYTVNPLSMVPLKMQPLRDASRAVRLIRRARDEFNIDPGRLAICGFSAGGHLSASLCVHWQDVDDPSPGYAPFSNRPDAALLCYPVITSGEKAHRGSFVALLGQDASAQELHYMSLETQVSEKTPPCFLWQTAEDDCVPVENSYLFAAACHTAGVDYAHHVFTKGQHGLSLANESWLAGNHGDNYCTAQIDALRAAVKSQKIPGAATDAMEGYFAPPGEPDPAYQAKLSKVCAQVCVWPQLAKAWLADILGQDPV